MKVWITKYALTDGIIEAESDEKTQTKKKYLLSGIMMNLVFSIHEKRKCFLIKNPQSRKPKECDRRKSRV